VILILYGFRGKLELKVVKFSSQQGSCTLMGTHLFSNTRTLFRPRVPLQPFAQILTLWGPGLKKKGFPSPLLRRESEFWVLKEMDFTPEKGQVFRRKFGEGSFGSF
jgi:hypothetical protein